MKEVISKLQKAFENRLRLGVMSILMVQEEVDFKFLKEKLNATDGNLASHTTALEKAGYIAIKKQFIGKKPNTTFKATAEGRQAFKEHLKALEELIKNI
ncbi:winged helix-turn-helix domain-containing protein [Aureibacter tunicatorum]|uniref:DNA-binding MarR family transcriptional regulator n=1 Tax=Aureibacter tunicatorum TaxID=866807 RepID=A0AAE3XRH2_9BACT|nr:transcriptional regulator [Aureibacter tunicatorum]MDR6240109.1 DNA-binding MarR family transcriptional regulator [Aureibacter tunicatorum]BDD06010.1 transcriptional regulator [Aureibacter tunicatorum]